MPIPAFACKCLVSHPVCQEVASTDFVFIGTVESVEPRFLDPWHATDAAAQTPIDEITRLQRDDSASSLTRLKDIYLKMFGDLPDAEKRQMQIAKTHQELDAVFSAIAGQGTRTTFRVRTVFRHPKDDDEDPPATSLVVWTGSDCGIDFQQGETYLVYADDDEETGRLETSICYRTKRLSDAGADLAYLYFFQNGGAKSSRLEGFVTSERFQDRPLNVDKIESPVADVVVGVKSGALSVYTRSDADGRYLFDGLAAGEYDVSAFDSGFPRTVRMLAGPMRLEVPDKGCASQVLAIPKAAAKKPK
ncbi:MAG: carboxypeptidase-like regulatory domain-containing protein [Bryobacteraceae bacterium]|jgi:hypothetical protein